MFYLKYLEKLTPLNFQKETIIIQKHRKSEEVFFIIKGHVLNQSSQRIFSQGSLIGETDIIYKRNRVETYIALDNVSALKYDRQTIQNIMDEFEDFKEDLYNLAQEREKIRLHRDEEGSTSLEEKQQLIDFLNHKIDFDLIHDTEENHPSENDLEALINHGLNNIEVLDLTPVKNDIKLTSIKGIGFTKSTLRLQGDKQFSAITEENKVSDTSMLITEDLKNTDQTPSLRQVGLPEQFELPQRNDNKVSSRYEGQDSEQETIENMEYRSPEIVVHPCKKESDTQVQYSDPRQQLHTEGMHVSPFKTEQRVEEQIKHERHIEIEALTKTYSQPSIVNFNAKNQEEQLNNIKSFINQYNSEDMCNDRFEKQSNVYSSIEVHFNRNIQRLDKMVFLIKKSKLVLNQYYKQFEAYLDRIARIENSRVNENILNNTKQAMSGIEKYLKILTMIECQIDSPRVFLEYIDSLKSIYVDQSSLIESLEQKIDHLMSTIKPSHIQDLENLLEKQLLEQPINNNFELSMDYESFRKPNVHDQLILKAQESEEIKAKGTPKNSIHRYADLYKLDDSSYRKNILNESQRGLLQGIGRYGKEMDNNESREEHETESDQSQSMDLKYMNNQYYLFNKNPKKGDPDLQSGVPPYKINMRQNQFNALHNMMHSKLQQKSDLTFQRIWYLNL